MGDHRVSDAVDLSKAKKDYSAFDAQLTHSALNFRMFVRLLGWLTPYKVTLLVSVIFILISAAISVLVPVMVGRVVIDRILLPTPMSDDVADYGMGALVTGVSNGIGLSMLMAAVVCYAGLVLGSAICMYIPRLTLSQSTLQALRDLRIDLFRKLETKPASFYDHVSVGRVMTRLTNDISNLVELLTGFGQLAGEFVPFFLALFLM